MAVCLNGNGIQDENEFRLCTFFTDVPGSYAVEREITVEFDKFT